jgi:hypothetical protein
LTSWNATKTTGTDAQAQQITKQCFFTEYSWIPVKRLVWFIWIGFAS